MTLKGVHIVFVTASTILCVFFGLWAAVQYSGTPSTGYIATSIISFVCAIGLVVYGIKFSKKIKV